MRLFEEVVRRKVTNEKFLKAINVVSDFLFDIFEQIMKVECRIGNIMVTWTFNVQRWFKLLNQSLCPHSMLCIVHYVMQKLAHRIEIFKPVSRAKARNCFIRSQKNSEHIRSNYQKL